MKKNNETKLRLARHTIKRLSDDKLAKVGGASQMQPCTFSDVSHCYPCVTR